MCNFGENNVVKLPAYTRYVAVDEHLQISLLDLLEHLVFKSRCVDEQ